MYLSKFYRLPVGSFGGILSKINPRMLGAYLMDQILEKEKNLNLDYLLVGCTVQASAGPNLSRQIVRQSNRMDDLPTSMINAGANTALSMVEIATSLIKQNKSIKNVGLLCVENLSLIPHYAYISPQEVSAISIKGKNMRNGLVLDASYDYENKSFSGIMMEDYLENTELDRHHMDLYTKLSFEKVMRSNYMDNYKEHIVPVDLNIDDGTKISLKLDQEYKRKALGRIGSFTSIFKEDGKITLANASKFGDGAAFVRISGVKKNGGITITNPEFAFAKATKSLDAGIASAKAILEKEEMQVDEFEAIEINESFSSCPLLYMKELNAKEEQINPYGGNVARANPTSVGGLISLGHATLNKGSTLVSSYDFGGVGMSLIVG